METFAGAWKNVRPLLLPSLLLVAAFALALLSSAARGQGQHYASAFLALTSLALAGVSSFLLVPKLLARVRVELFNFRFLRLTRRGVAFFLLVLLIGFCALNTGNNLLILILSALLASMIVSGLISNLVLHKLAVSVRMPRELHAGEKVALRVTLENRKRWLPSFALLLSTGRTGAGDRYLELPEKTFPYIPPRRRAGLRTDYEFVRRGDCSLEDFEVRTGFPFGFLIRGRTLPMRGKVTVYPRLVDVGPLLRALREKGNGRLERTRRGMGAGLYKIREFQGGDTTRFVHWKSSAKLGRLMVKDFLDEEELPACLVFSRFLPHDRPAAKERFEHAVSCLASLGRHFRQQGRAFNFYSGNFAVAVNGNAESYGRFMEFLARTAPAEAPDPPAEPRAGAVLFAAGDAVQHPAAIRVDYLEP